jgi:hypothetical protein
VDRLNGDGNVRSLCGGEHLIETIAMPQRDGLVEHDPQIMRVNAIAKKD